MKPCPIPEEGLRDADGNRYLIEDLITLDARSRRMLDLYL